jgi:hypothetical protein
MTTKTKTTGKPPVQPQAAFDGPAPDDMRAAFEIHTLAQMMYGQIARTNPWVAQAPPMTGPTPYASHPQVPQTQWGQQTPWPQQTQWPQQAQYAQQAPQWPIAWNPWAPWWGR